MGLVGLEKICQSLIAHGSPENFTNCLDTTGTTHNQRVIIGTLAPTRTDAQLAIKPPTLIILVPW